MSFDKFDEPRKEESVIKKPEKKIVNKDIRVNQGTGTSGACFGKNSPRTEKKTFERICLACKDGKEIIPIIEDKTPIFSDKERKTLQISSKPRADYTDIARQNQVQGKVILRVTFLASGQIGKIIPITNLPDGLTDQAITAAKQIKFRPAVRNEKPITISRNVEYNFTIY